MFIKKITQEEATKMINHFESALEDGNSSLYGKYYVLNPDNTYTAIDNTDGNCRCEDFTCLTDVLKYFGLDKGLISLYDLLDSCYTKLDRYVKYVDEFAFSERLSNYYTGAVNTTKEIITMLEEEIAIYTRRLESEFEIDLEE